MLWCGSHKCSSQSLGYCWHPRHRSQQHSAGPAQICSHKLQMCIVMQNHPHRQRTRNGNVLQQSILEQAVPCIHLLPCSSLGYACCRDCSLETAYDTRKGKLTLWDYATVGVTILMWISTDCHLMIVYFSSMARLNRFWLLPTLPPLCAACFHSCSKGAIPLLQHFSSPSAVWFSSLEYPTSYLPSTAEHGYLQNCSANGDLSSWIQKWGLPLFSGRMTQDPYFSAWTKPTTPCQQVLQEAHHQGVTLGQACHFMPCCCTEKSITSCQKTKI